MNFLRTVIAHLLPTECIVCSRHQNAMLCIACLSFLKKHNLFNYKTCVQCGIGLSTPDERESHCSFCQEMPPAFDSTYSLDRYEGVLQHAIHQLKYQKRLAFANGLALAWNQLAMPYFSNSADAILIPVPLSDIKLHHRGFNQSWEIAKRLHVSPSIQTDIHTLRRHHRSHDQVRGTRLDRQESLRNVFYLNPKTAHRIQNRNVIVFDDVMTTGSTLQAIASLLKDNGARKVINWVILRTSHPN